jgi:hypothetical protein
MARRKSEILPLPTARGLNIAQTAAYLGKSVSWFLQHRPELETYGFPRRLPMMDAYDRIAIDDWFDRLGGREQAVEKFDWKPPRSKEERLQWRT